jgi:hypothetical protein
LVHLGLRDFSWDNLASRSSKHQYVVSRSSAEAEYCSVANGVAEACWLCQLLQELHSPLRRSTLVYCDNISVVYLSTNPVQHTRHIEIDLHFVREKVSIGEVRIVMFLQCHSSWTSSRKGCFSHCFLSFSPVLTSVVAKVLTEGVLELLLFVLCVGRLGRILCEYLVQPIGNLGARYCSSWVPSPIYCNPSLSIQSSNLGGISL